MMGYSAANRAMYLTLAARVLERDGWCQGQLHLPGGGHCMEGAIAVATGYHYAPGGRFHEAIETQRLVTMDVMGTVGRAIGSALAPWNDAAHRTREEVIAVLRDVAAMQTAVALLAAGRDTAW